MIHFIKHIALSVLLLIAAMSFSQKSRTDSLPYLPLLKDYETYSQSNTNLKQTLNTTNNYIKKAQALNDRFFLADAFLKHAITFYHDNNYDSAQANAKKAILYSEYARNFKAQMSANNLLGAICYNTGDLKLSETYYLKKLRIAARAEDSVAFYATYYNLGLIYLQRGEYLKASDFNFKGIPYFEQQKDTFNLLSAIQLIGYCYQNLQDIPTAIRFYKRAVQLSILTKDKYQLTGVYLDLHTAYLTKEVKDSALYYVEEALRIAKEEKDEFHYTMALTRKGSLLINYKEPRKALPLLWEAMNTNLTSQRIFALCEDYAGLANAYLELGKYDSALVFAYKGQKIATDQKNKSVLESCSKILFSVYDKRGNADSALKYHKAYIEINTALKKEDQLRGIAQREQLFEKHVMDKQRLQEQLLAETKLEKQKQINLIVFAASFLLLIFLVISIINYRQKQKANLQISHQKKILEERNKEVSDSINYASRIQQSIMPSAELLQEISPLCEVLYMPRDIVSGDFYWVNALPNRPHIIVYAVADCTGHGVPGAFMSLIGATLLNQTITHPNINSPAQALDYLNIELPKNIKSNVAGETIKDGMEISMCLIDFENLILEFSGANNNLYLIRKGELKLIRGNKQPIGQGFQNATLFTNHTIALEKDDTICLFTDGYPDQFGGPYGKKFKYKQLEDLILKLNPLPLPEQKEQLKTAFYNWKGDMDQVDDVLLMLIKV